MTKKVYEEIQRNFLLLIYFPTNLNKVEVDAQTKSLRLYNELNDQMLPGYCTAYSLLNNVRHFNCNFWRKYPDDLKCWTRKNESTENLSQSLWLNDEPTTMHLRECEKGIRLDSNRQMPGNLRRFDDFDFSLFILDRTEKHQVGYSGFDVERLSCSMNLKFTEFFDWMISDHWSATIRHSSDSLPRLDSPRA